MPYKDPALARAANRKSYRKRKAEEVAARANNRSCSECATSFDASGYKSRSTACSSDCQNLRQIRLHKTWCESPVGRARDKHQASKRRALKRAGAIGSISRHIETNLYADQFGCCAYCDTFLLRREDWHLDHIIPLAKGGAHAEDNLTLACVPCNLSKGSKLPEEFTPRVQPH